MQKCTNDYNMLHRGASPVMQGALCDRQKNRIEYVTWNMDVSHAYLRMCCFVII